jgi:hypothetical protein
MVYELHHAFLSAPSPVPSLSQAGGICKSYFHAVDDQQDFGEVEVLPCSGRGDDEGGKACHIGGRLCSEVVSFKALLMSGVGNPLWASAAYRGCWCRLHGSKRPLSVHRYC